MIAFTKKCFSGEWDYDAAFKRQMGGGGLVAYLGTSDIQEVERRIDAGDEKADFYFNAMIYQIAKDIGGMATVMNGQVDRVILTGEIARSARLVERLRARVEFIAPVEVVPGAVEMPGSGGWNAADAPGRGACAGLRHGAKRLKKDGTT